jgi:hypothetical protein
MGLILLGPKAAKLQRKQESSTLLKNRDRFLGSICPINYELPSSGLLIFGYLWLMNTGMHRNAIKWMAFRLAKPNS